MSPVSQQIVDMLNMLPEKEQDFACEVMRKLVLAWDPDYTKLTPAEAERLDVAEKQIAAGEYYDDSEIDWDNLDNMNLD